MKKIDWLQPKTSLKSIYLFVIRETVPLLTSDIQKKTVSVLAHYFLLPQRANSGYTLFIYPLKYSRS